jgi:hypothetical protein
MGDDQGRWIIGVSCRTEALPTSVVKKDCEIRILFDSVHYKYCARISMKFNPGLLESPS